MSVKSILLTSIKQHGWTGFKAVLWLLTPFWTGCQTEQPSFVTALEQQVTSRELQIVRRIKLTDQGAIRLSTDSSVRQYDRKNRLVIKDEQYYYQYDSLGRLTDKWFFTEDKSTRHWQYVYDPDGKLSRIEYLPHQDSLFLWKNFEYDTAKRLQREVWYKAPQDSLQVLGTHFYQYPSDRQKMMITTHYLEEESRNDSTFIIFLYDSLARLTKKIEIANNESGLTYQTQYRYDTLGRSASIRFSGLMPPRDNIADYPYRRLVYTYDQQGRKKEAINYLETSKGRIPYTKTLYTYKKLPAP
ncbi:MAG: hypothetical protein ACFB0B_09360 [Thermonemataceae bacterium]